MSRRVKLLLGGGAATGACRSDHKSLYEAAIENGFTDVARQIQSRRGGITRNASVWSWQRYQITRTG